MPRHEQISPEEDLVAFYGGASGGASSAPERAGAGSADAAAGARGAAVFAATISSHEDLPIPGARPEDPASSPKRLAPVQRPMPTFPPPAPPSHAEAPRPEIAAILSLVLPGAGQLYVGQPVKGLVIFTVGLLTCMLGGLMNVAAAHDAWRTAKRRLEGEPAHDWPTP